ncbi:ATP-binding domain-containing protein [Domibacillus mangrovi]|uniref:DNA/RNA helicase n=1 Tax=Domibacillus mangrovi TaxID=1714354 RepID=A0A1Q5P691_9BACI|nr:nuclease-related domain-containing DEAD/DEAH box helicase [Domibacillus mangrovi]OKL37612.1 DNA/RNA helicase [Domibacillus mangrovi]
MAIGEKDRKFIATEPFGIAGEKGEQKVWDAVKSAFSSRTCIGYWRFPIFSKVGQNRKEPDILIADQEQGLIVIEVKAININQIAAVNGHRWEYKNFYTDSGNPYEQAENQLFSLLSYFDREPETRRKISGTVLIALPEITESEWIERGFDKMPSCPPIIFKDQMGKSGLLKKIQTTKTVIEGIEINSDRWEVLLSILGGNPILRKEQVAVKPNLDSRAAIISMLADRLYELDLQQEQIGKVIPPGPQRIRGIAGSGKTVLLCQRAAHMHLKHPDWDIALVFFSRSLYNEIVNQIDKWLKHFTNGEVRYDEEVKRKLRVLPAWGARDREGFYGRICDAHGVRRLTPGDTINKNPTNALAEVCTRLLSENEIEPLFDAVLIDEGQDLVVEDHLKFQGKQPFYWLAFQALRPVSAEDPFQKRLIWAYDESQSLENLIIPKARELFGSEESYSQMVTGIHPGGIRKSEIMHRCYRTPGPILTAAHAIGMGLLRSEGMLRGITNKEDWAAIGYEVIKGNFRTGEEITLHRPPKNSPNLVPSLWNSPVLQFNTYNSREEELKALAISIKENIQKDQLELSRDIMIIVLGGDARNLERETALFLMNENIDIYIPSALEKNVTDPRYPNTNPDKFWEDGAVTISRIHRAKGNEANMVYVVGFDQVACNESETALRNQLFVGLTRARGWASLSGIGEYGMYQEMNDVINSGDTFTFTFKRAPIQNINDIDEQIPVELR